ncbi:MAG: type II toxin-antitoxin system VapC family toxin [Sphingomonadales bacterium]|uniref:type II toxin-antitoxin system VapC family toxin n=1 Tax=Novosphingobium sp. NDB2Meth1 TaxID=1892847 RepID=UPI00092FDDC7|nr:type II toxin-antitoxin system VapC family toxin [Novosphingobium sp. NDB2Meth1]MBU6396102.1 type II toxin-antitoxin system VapC family toxin [Sphingomonadales bacterium]
MIVDSSAMVAMLWKEPEAAPFLSAIIAAGGGSISAGNYLEASIVIDKQRDPAISAGLDNLLAELEIDIAPVTATQARLARQAYRDFGKGSGHPAQLNYGDCFAYALAVERGEPLLYKGDDFAHAGLARVVA